MLVVFFSLDEYSAHVIHEIIQAILLVCYVNRLERLSDIFGRP